MDKVGKKTIREILLIGGSFRNKGAEAMVLSAVHQFSGIYPGCRLTVASYVKRESRAYGIYTTGLNSSSGSPATFELIRNTKKVSHPFKIFLWWLLPFSGIRDFLIRGDVYLERFLLADLVVDLSGFALTDRRSVLRRLVYCFEIFSSWCFGVPFVVFTQALGPFRHPVSRLAARLFLPHVALLIARGRVTADYVARLGVVAPDALPVCSDTAFLFEPAKEEKNIGLTLVRQAKASRKPLIGLIPNINIFRRMHPRNERSPYIKMLVGLCDYAQVYLDAHIVFICHEHYEYRRDDTWIVQKLRSQVSYPDAITMIDGTQSAGVLKVITGEMDFVMVSRFHCLVAAISTATPFLALGWAHKYQELADDAGSEEWVIDFERCTSEDLRRAFAAAWNKREETRLHLEKKREYFRSSAAHAYQLIADKWPP
ncbi:MAG: polysaccharide pyruvyl transferase family protein [Chitinispirillaceae bacterium]|nr:polysaccharide pyruvyl transferase family protein [Chitinispirillaceae bacterium]